MRSISLARLILCSLPFICVGCSSITKPIEGKYAEKSGKGTLLIRAEGTFHEDPPKSKNHSGEGEYSLDGTQILAGYKFKDGGGFAVDVNHGKRLDDDTLLWGGKTFVRQSSLQANTPSSGSPSSASGSRLTVENVQRAVDRALDWTRKGGGATVLGIQELPQENAARADIQFNNFQYAADSLGSPVSKDKQPKPVPKDRLPTPEEYMEQLNRPRAKSYSGRGVATLKHYNDGRWVLTAVHFDFDGIKTNIEIQ